MSLYVQYLFRAELMGTIEYCYHTMYQVKTFKNQNNSETRKGSAVYAVFGVDAYAPPLVKRHTYFEVRHALHVCAR